MKSSSLATSEIVKNYRKRQSLSQEDFGQALGVTKMAVSYWERGIQIPSFLFLFDLIFPHSGWVRDFALDCMAAQSPHVQPASDIGRSVLVLQ